MANLPLLAGTLEVLGCMKQMCYSFGSNCFHSGVSPFGVKGPIALLMKAVLLGQ